MDNQTNNRIREEKLAEHQTWIRENLWCKEHLFPKVDITCDECRKLMPLREKCDASFANSLNFIDELLKSQERSLRINVGMLRQWLNEDVITDSSKLVENEDLLSWLIKQSK